MEADSSPQLREEEEDGVVKEEEEKASPPAASISLRPFDLSDVDDYMVWASDEKVSRFCSWDTYTSRDDLLEYLKEKVLPHPYIRAICTDGRPVGAISVSPFSGNDRCRAEVGYVLASGYWGRGIAAAAVKKVAATVFGEMPELERLEAVVDVENVGSQRVVEKAGFAREAVLRKYCVVKGRSRDMVLYSFLSTDPLPPLIP